MNMQMPNRDHNLTIGIDIGGTKIEGIVIDENNNVLKELRIPSRIGEKQVVDDITRVAKELSETPIPVGIGIPGQVNWNTGCVKNVVNLGITTLELGSEVCAKYGASVHVENDVNAAALGATSLVYENNTFENINTENCDSTVVMLNFGTGLAAGVVKSGRALHGFSGAYGEIGHIPVDANMFDCPCGQKGCLETVASGGAISRLWPYANPAMPDLISKAEDGNPQAKRVLDMVVHAMVDAVQIVVHAYDPQIIAIGGGVARTGEKLLKIICEELNNRASTCPFLQSLNVTKRLVLVPSNQPVGALGAAISARINNLA